jgi:hypothetical protein
VILGAGTNSASAQMLNWEGQTGVFVTPLAYTAPSHDRSLRPVVSYHYLNAGEVLGGFDQMSITTGAFDRIEFGYTRSAHRDGSTAGLSDLWGGGFNTVHGKFNFLTENAGKQAWLPALSTGFVVRTQVRNVGGILQGQNTNNADFYLVATKTLAEIRQLPLVLSFGYKATNASLLGLVGNAPGYYGRMFGAVAIPFKGPKGSTIMLASEFLQQPPRVDGLPGVVVPTTITYAVRFVPSGAYPYEHGWGERKPRFTIDFGIAQAAGTVAPGVNLHARRQFAMGISYGF